MNSVKPWLSLPGRCLKSYNKQLFPTTNSILSFNTKHGQWWSRVETIMPFFIFANNFRGNLRNNVMKIFSQKWALCFTCCWHRLAFFKINLWENRLYLIFGEIYVKFFNFCCFREPICAIMRNLFTRKFSRK
jgi:hypothetical protein